MGILERIKEIEFEMSRTQKNKATNYHLGTLKAKIAKLRTELMDGSKGTKQAGEGFDVLKSGDARVAMVGFPSVGKSSLLNELTNTASEAAAYDFTTLTCIPGVIQYNQAQIQLLDLPGIIAGAAKGAGRGRQVIGVARTADVILMMLDAEKAEVQRRLLTKELESVGIRLNKRVPDVVLRKKKTVGSCSFTATCELNKGLDEALALSILKEYKMHSTDVLVREDCSVDEFIDLVEGNRVYIRCLYCINRCDMVSLKQVDQLARMPDTVIISIKMKMNLDLLLERIWDYLAFVRIYTKPRAQKPDLSMPTILRKGATVETVCHHIHRDLSARFKYALVWGTSSKHQPQRVGISHAVQDEDVVQIMTK